MNALRRVGDLYRLLGPHTAFFWLTIGATAISALWSLAPVLAASGLIQSVAHAAGVAAAGFAPGTIFHRASGLLGSVPAEHRILVGFITTAVAMVASSLVGLGTLWIGGKLLSRFTAHLQTLCFDRMLGCRMDFHDETRRSQLNQLLIVEVRSCHALMKEFTTLVVDLFQVVVGTIVLLTLSPSLTIVFFVVGLTAAVITQRLNRITKQWSRTALASRQELMAVTQESLYGIKPVKALGYEAPMRARFARHAANTVRLLVKVSVLVNGQSTLVRVFGLLGVTLIVVANLAGGLGPTAGGLVLFLFVAYSIVHPAAGAARSWGIMNEALVPVDSVLAFLEQEPAARERSGTVQKARLIDDRLVLDDVWLDYERRPGILRGVSLAIRRGERVGIVGGSGSGKTSLVNLLPRLYDPAKGSVTIDGVDLRDFRLDFLRGRIGLLSQDVFIFNTTVRENIVMGRPGASDDEIVRAAKLAHAHEFVTTLPQGYDTVVGDRGVKLSGGQRQRINIAQVFLKSPEILILDEATSALDSESEALVQDAIDRLAEDRTVIMVAHRLSTLREVDRVVVLEDGVIVEEGGWDELLRRRGAFARMWEMQTSAVG